MDDIPHVRTRPGQRWKLVHFGPPNEPAPPLPGSDLTLEFTATEVGARLGCNSGEGSYELDGHAFCIPGLMSTLKWCGDTALMEQEHRYRQALHAVRTFVRTDDTLSLFYPGGVLRYVAVAIPPGQVGWFAARAADLASLRRFEEELRQQERDGAGTAHGCGT